MKPLLEILTAVLCSATDIPPRFKVKLHQSRGLTAVSQHYDTLLAEGRALVLVGGVGSGKTLACYAAFAYQRARQLKMQSAADVEHALQFREAAQGIIDAGIDVKAADKPEHKAMELFMRKLAAERIELARTALSYDAEAWRERSIAKYAAELVESMHTSWYAGTNVHKAQALNDLAIRDETEWERIMYSRRLLAIDDLGADHDRTGWAAAKWQLALDHRYEQQAPTLVTSNLDYEALSQRLGERMADRLREWGIVVDLATSSLRVAEVAQ